MGREGLQCVVGGPEGQAHTRARGPVGIAAGTVAPGVSAADG